MPDIDEIIREAEAMGSTRLDSMLEGIADRLGQKATARTVFGEPVERDGVTIIPVAKVRWGFGGGQGAGTGGGHDGHLEAGEGGGGGGGLTASPLGYIEVRNGVAEFKPIKDPAAMWPVMLAGAISVWIVARALRAIFR